MTENDSFALFPAFSKERDRDRETERKKDGDRERERFRDSITRDSDL